MVRLRRIHRLIVVAAVVVAAEAAVEAEDVVQTRNRTDLALLLMGCTTMGRTSNTYGCPKATAQQQLRLLRTALLLTLPSNLYLTPLCPNLLTQTHMVCVFATNVEWQSGEVLWLSSRYLMVCVGVQLLTMAIISLLQVGNE